MGKVAVAANAVAKIMRRMPSELRARFRSKAEERMFDELLDHIARGAADQDDDDRVGAGEDRGPLMPGIDLLFGLLIGVLAVWVLIATGAGVVILNSRPATPP
jgi:hypothetical protein